MDHTIFSSGRKSIISSHNVLRNTYFLLGMTLTFSAIIATLSTVFSFPSPGIIITLIGFYGLMFLTYKLSNSIAGIFSTFAFTGFLGYCLGPILNNFIISGMSDVIAISLGGTALVFFCCSAWVLLTNKDMSFLNGMMITGIVVLMLFTIINLFLKLPLLHLVISTMFILFSAIAILLETSNIIHGGETNYIRATVSLYVSLYNIFISLLSVIGYSRSKE